MNFVQGRMAGNLIRKYIYTSVNLCYLYLLSTDDTSVERLHFYTYMINIHS